MLTFEPSTIGQEVALDAAARHVRAVPGVAAGDLVDLVDEDDPGVLRAVERLADDAIHVDEPGRLLLGEQLQRLLHLELALALLRAAPEHRDDGVVAELAHHVLEPLRHVLHAGRHEGHGRRLLGELDLDEIVVERPGAELRAGPLAPAGRARRLRLVLPAHPRHGAPEAEPEAAAVAERVEHLLLRRLPRALAQLLDLLLLHELHRGLDEVAHHRVHVAADVAHLGELGGLDLHERRAGEPGEPPRDLGLSHAGGADHHDVLREDLVLQLRADLLAPPAVAERDRDRALRLRLPDHVAVELGDDLLRRQVLWLHGLELLEREVRVRVDADLRRELHGLLGDLARGERRVGEQRAGRRDRVGRAGADRDDRAARYRIGLDDVARAGEDEHVLAVGDDEQRLEPAKEAVGAPLLRELDRRARERPRVLLELLLEELEELERVGGRARRTRRGPRPPRAGGPSARWTS